MAFLALQEDWVSEPITILFYMYYSTSRQYVDHVKVMPMQAWANHKKEGQFIVIIIFFKACPLYPFAFSLQDV